MNMKNTNTGGRQATALFALGVFVISASVQIPLVGAESVAYFTLAEKIRKSELIVVGTVADVRPDSLVVNVGKVPKGTTTRQSIEVELWGAGAKFPQYKAGDPVVVFGTKKGSRYTSFVDHNGMKLDSSTPAENEAAIKSFMDYDVAKSTEQKRLLLHAMLRGDNRLLQRCALLDFVYISPNTRNQGFANDDLLPALDKLARGSDVRIVDLAVQIIGKTHGRKSIPILIDLMQSKNNASVEAASRYINAEIRRVSEKDAPYERRRSISEVKDWWEANKSQYR